MNINTGEILTEEELKKRDKSFRQFCIQVDTDDMQPWQRKSRRVSRFDTKSTLGKQRVKAVNKIGRNKPCPCGSGKKYKKCCLGLA